MSPNDSKFFYELTPERILAAVERLGIRCTGRCLSLQSMENRVYEVEIEVADEAALKSVSDRFRVAKFYRPGRWTEQQILEEHEFLFDLVKAEVPVVAPICEPGGDSLFLLPEFNIWYAVFPKQGGRSPSELNDEEVEQVGRLLARLHQVGAQKKAEHRLKLSVESFGSSNLRYLLDAKVVPDEFRPHFTHVVESICRTVEPWFSNVPLQRIHGDAHLGNLLWGSSGGFWVDFDDMLRGPCVQDMWLVVIGRDSEAKRKRELLVSAYESMRSFDRATLALIEPLRALRMIHYNAWIARRFEDPAFQRTFPHFGTTGYWREHVSDLQDQLEFIQGREELD